MKEKNLKSYLIKAEYLLVFIHSLKKNYSQLPYTGVHIPSMDFTATIKANKGINNALSQRFSEKEQIEIIKRILHLEKPLKISLINKTFENNSVFRSVETISTINQRQDLHLLHYGMIYCANRSRKDKPIKGWKISCSIVMIKQFQSVLSAPVAKAQSKNLHSFTILNRFKETLSQKKEEDFLNLNQSLEKEYSERRNYLTTSHLHT